MASGGSRRVTLSSGASSHILSLSQGAVEGTAYTDQPLVDLRNHRELKRERAWSRIHLVPMLLAEADRDVYRREQGQLAREKEIMKDVPEWEVGSHAYSSGHWRIGSDRPIFYCTGWQERLQQQAIRSQPIRVAIELLTYVAIALRYGRD